MGGLVNSTATIAELGGFFNGGKDKTGIAIVIDLSHRPRHVPSQFGNFGDFRPRSGDNGSLSDGGDGVNLIVPYLEILA